MEKKNLEEIIEELESFLLPPPIKQTTCIAVPDACFVCGEPFQKGESAKRLMKKVEQALKSYALWLIEEGGPEEREIEDVGFCADESDSYSNGYNSAISDYKQNLLDLLEK